MKTASWLKENVEAIAIAVVMALVIRQFSIEAFKIPTGSMSPTLYGDSANRSGDRILVDKIGALFSDPDRFNVVVFKFPLNAAKNYIKRIVGFGGEMLEIRDGDIFINGEIARKPPDVQEVLFYEIYPEPQGDEKRPRQALQSWYPYPFEQAIEPVGEGGFRLTATEGEHLAVYKDRILDACPWADLAGEDDVGDVKLTFEVTPAESSGGEVVVRIVDNRIENELVLAVGEGASYLRHGNGVRKDLDGVVLEPGETVEVSFANVDDALRVEVDGEEFELLYRTEQVEHGADGVRFGVRDGEATFEEIRLYRDLFYVSDNQTYEIPEGHFFALGDNSRSSKDSRKWRLRVFEMRNGEKYYYDVEDRDEESREHEDRAAGTVTFQDRDGIMRTLKKSEISTRSRVIPAHFVPRKNLIGRAFFVFWPLPPFDDHFRIKFIR